MINEDRVEKLTKVFVGNVPFQCTQEEFKQCFSTIPGFISAEIVNRHNSTFSRGFGFVTLSSKELAKNLINRNDMAIKDRILRFTEYNFQDNNFQDKKKVNKAIKNYLFVKNFPKDITKEQIKEIFSQYGEIGACFIDTNTKTGESRGNAVIEIKDNSVFEKLLRDETITTNGYILLVSKWKNKTKIIKPKQNKIDPKEIYRIAFNAGVNVGRLEALRYKN